MGEVVGDGVINAVGSEIEISDPAKVRTRTITSLGFGGDDIRLPGPAHGQGQSPIVDVSSVGNVYLPGSKPGNIDGAIDLCGAGESIGCSADAGRIVVFGRSREGDGCTRIVGSPNIGPVFTIAMDIRGR